LKLGRLRSFFFASFVTYGAFLPFFPTWLEARGVRGLSMSAIMALGPATGIVGPPLFGALSDWLGLRAGLLRLATAGCFVAMLGLAAPGALGHEPAFPLLFGAILLFSISRAPSIAMADVIAIEATKIETETTRAPSYGGVRLWGSIGFLLAALAAGRAIDLSDRARLPAVLAASSFMTFALTLWLDAPAPPRAAHLGASIRGVLRDRRFVLLLASGFLGFGAHVSYDICFSLHLQSLGLGSSGVGLAWALGVIGEVAMMAVSGRILARVPASSLLVVAYAGGAVRWSILALVPNVTVLLALQPLHAISFALFWVTALEHVKRCAPGEILATAQGLFNAAVGAGAVLGMLAWGALFERHGGRITFGCAAAVAMCAAILASAIDGGSRRAAEAG
jgi:PPP family 3-phenylpropionic acid transporter